MVSVGTIRFLATNHNNTKRKGIMLLFGQQKKGDNQSASRINVKLTNIDQLGDILLGQIFQVLKMSLVLCRGNTVHREGDATDAFGNVYAEVLKINNNSNYGAWLFRIAAKSRRRMTIGCITGSSCTFRVCVTSKDEGETVKIGRCCLEHSCNGDQNTEPLKVLTARKPPLKFQKLIHSTALKSATSTERGSAMNLKKATDTEGLVSLGSRTAYRICQSAVKCKKGSEEESVALVGQIKRKRSDSPSVKNRQRRGKKAADRQEEQKQEAKKMNQGALEV